MIDAVTGSGADRKLTEPTPRRRRWDWAFAMAAVVAVFFAGLFVMVSNQHNSAESLAAVLEADDAGLNCLRARFC